MSKKKMCPYCKGYKGYGNPGGYCKRPRNIKCPQLMNCEIIPTPNPSKAMAPLFKTGQNELGLKGGERGGEK